MAPKQRIVVSGSNGSQKGFFGTAYDEITSPENTTIVRSVLVFAAGVAFFHSSLGELLVPPLIFLYMLMHACTSIK